MQRLQLIQYAWRCLTQRLRSITPGKTRTVSFAFALSSSFFFLLTCRVEQAESPLSTRSSVQLFEPPDILPERFSITKDLKVGVGIDEFEPSEPTSLAGFGGINRRFLLPNPDQIGGPFTYFLPYERIDAAPRVKTIVLEGLDDNNQKQTLVLVSVDLVAVTSDMVTKFIVAYNDITPDRNLNFSNVHAFATHTHAGPGGLSQHPFWAIFASERYNPILFDEFMQRVRVSYEKAISTLKTVGQMRASTGVLDGFSRSRFEGMPVDNHQTHLQFFDTNNHRYLCAQFFAVHPTFFGQSQRTLSSDVAGHIERAMSLNYTGVPCLFFNTSVGNADYDNLESLDDYSQKFFESVSNPVNFVPQPVPKTVFYASKTFGAPNARLNFKACQLEDAKPFVNLKVLESLPTKLKIGYFTIGDILFVFLPGEAVYTVTKKIRDALSAQLPQMKSIYVLSNANDYLGYLVPAENFDSTNLEACSSLYGAGFVDQIVSQVKDLVTGFGPTN